MISNPSEQDSVRSQSQQNQQMSNSQQQSQYSDDLKLQESQKQQIQSQQSQEQELEYNVVQEMLDKNKPLEPKKDFGVRHQQVQPLNRPKARIVHVPQSKLPDPKFYKEKTRYAFDEQKKNQYDAYPHRRPGPNLDDKRQTDIVPDVKLRKFNYATNTADLNNIQWDNIEALALSEGGSQGVVFIETNDGALVLKGSTDIAIEFYLQKLQKILKIPVPQMKIIHWTDKEFKKCTFEIQRAAFTDELLHYRIKPRIDMPYLLAMEYIPGVQIDRLAVRRAAYVLTHQTPESRDRLIRLGFILAFDTFINNYDRFPCGNIWDNDGNIGNVVLKAKTSFTTNPDQMRDPNDLETEFERFYALDPRVSLVNIKSPYTQKVLEQYYEKVETFLNDILMELKEVMEARIDPFYEDIGNKLGSIKRFSTFIFNYTGYQMKEIQLLQVMIGIALGMNNIVELNIDRVGQLYINMFMKDKVKDWKGYWNKNLEQINVEVLADVLKVFTKLSQVYPDVIQWCTEITLGEYKVDIIEWEKAMGIYEGNEEEDEKKIAEQYGLPKKKKNEDDSDSEYDGKSDGAKTDENYDQDDDFHRKVNDIFYLDLNQLEEDLQKGRDITHYNKTAKELATMKPEIFEN